MATRDATQVKDVDAAPDYTAGLIPYRCPKCGNHRRFATLRELKVHLESEHAYDIGCIKPRTRANCFDKTSKILSKQNANIKTTLGKSHTDTEMHLDETVVKTEEIPNMLPSNTCRDSPLLQSYKDEACVLEMELQMAKQNEMRNKTVSLKDLSANTVNMDFKSTLNSLTSEVIKSRRNEWNTTDALHRSHNVLQGLEVAAENKVKEQRVIIEELMKGMKQKEHELNTANKEHSDLKYERERLFSESEDLFRKADMHSKTLKEELNRRSEVFGALNTEMEGIKLLSQRELQNREMELQAANERMQRLEWEKKRLVEETDVLLKKADEDSTQLKSTINNKESELRSVNQELIQMKHDQQMTLEKTMDLYKRAEEGTSIMRSMLSTKDDELQMANDQLERMASVQVRLVEQSHVLSDQADGNVDAMKRLLRMKEDQVTEVIKQLERLREEKQRLEGNTSSMAEQAEASSSAIENLQQMVNGKEGELNTTKTELRDLKSFLKAVAEKERSARKKLEKFITELISRAEKAESEVRALRSQTVSSSDTSGCSAVKTSNFPLYSRVIASPEDPTEHKSLPKTIRPPRKPPRKRYNNGVKQTELLANGAAITEDKEKVYTVIGNPGNNSNSRKVEKKVHKMLDNHELSVLTNNIASATGTTHTHTNADHTYINSRDIQQMGINQTWTDTSNTLRNDQSTKTVKQEPQSANKRQPVGGGVKNLADNMDGANVSLQKNASIHDNTPSVNNHRMLHNRDGEYNGINDATQQRENRELAYIPKPTSELNEYSKDSKLMLSSHHTGPYHQQWDTVPTPHRPQFTISRREARKRWRSNETLTGYCAHDRASVERTQNYSSPGNTHDVMDTYPRHGGIRHHHIPEGESHTFSHNRNKYPSQPNLYHNSRTFEHDQYSRDSMENHQDQFNTLNKENYNIHQSNPDVRHHYGDNVHDETMPADDWLTASQSNQAYAAQGMSTYYRNVNAMTCRDSTYGGPGHPFCNRNTCHGIARESDIRAMYTHQPGVQDTSMPSYNQACVSERREIGEQEDHQFRIVENQGNRFISPDTRSKRTHTGSQPAFMQKGFDRHSLDNLTENEQAKTRRSKLSKAYKTKMKQAANVPKGLITDPWDVVRSPEELNDEDDDLHNFHTIMDENGIMWEEDMDTLPDISDSELDRVSPSGSEAEATKIPACPAPVSALYDDDDFQTVQNDTSRLPNPRRNGNHSGTDGRSDERTYHRLAGGRTSAKSSETAHISPLPDTHHHGIGKHEANTFNLSAVTIKKSLTHESDDVANRENSKIFKPIASSSIENSSMSERAMTSGGREVNTILRTSPKISIHGLPASYSHSDNASRLTSSKSQKDEYVTRNASVSEHNHIQQKLELNEKINQISEKYKSKRSVAIETCSESTSSGEFDEKVKHIADKYRKRRQGILEGRGISPSPSPNRTYISTMGSKSSSDDSIVRNNDYDTTVHNYGKSDGIHSDSSTKYRIENTRSEVNKHAHESEHQSLYTDTHHYNENTHRLNHITNLEASLGFVTRVTDSANEPSVINKTEQFSGASDSGTVQTQITTEEEKRMEHKHISGTPTLDILSENHFTHNHNSDIVPKVIVNKETDLNGRPLAMAMSPGSDVVTENIPAVKTAVSDKADKYETEADIEPNSETMGPTAIPVSDELKSDKKNELKRTSGPNSAMKVLQSVSETLAQSTSDSDGFSIFAEPLDDTTSTAENSSNRAVIGRTDIYTEGDSKSDIMEYNPNSSSSYLNEYGDVFAHKSARNAYSTTSSQG